MDDKVGLRKQAIRMYLAHESVSKIAITLGKSRPWVYKWIERYKSNPQSDWFVDHPSVPKNPANKLNPSLERQIIELRKKLAGNKYAQTGAISIQYEFQRLGQQPPAIWTINRVLKRHELIPRHSKRHKEKKLTLSYL